MATGGCASPCGAARAGNLRAWPLAGGSRLAGCVEEALRRAPRPEGAADLLAADITLTDPLPVDPPRLGLLGALSPSASLESASRESASLESALGSALGQGCDRAVERLSQRLGPPASAPPLSIRETQVPASSSGAPLTRPGAVINVYGSAFPVVLDDQNTQLDGEAAGAFIARNVRRGRPLYIAAHRDIPLSRLFAILGPLRARGPLHLIVRVSALGERPPADASALAGPISAAMGSCREGMAVLRRLASRLPLQRANFLREELPPALRGCRCQGADVGRLGALLEPMLADEAELRALPFRLAPSAASAIPLPPEATVDDLARAAASASGDTPAFRLEPR